MPSQGQLLLFGTPLDAVRDMVHRSDYQAILAKGTIDLVRWSAPVQLLKYATRTVWFKNVNTGYPVDPKFIMNTSFILMKDTGLDV
jgi:hypothetical protein